MGIHNIDTALWSKMLRAAQLRKATPKENPLNSVPDLPQPEFVWDDCDYSAQSDRWDAGMSLRCCVSVLVVMGVLAEKSYSQVQHCNLFCVFADLFPTSRELLV